MDSHLLIRLLQCIYCGHGEFSYHAFSDVKPEDTGLFLCRKCHRYYGVEHGILDCLPDDLADTERRKSFASLIPRGLVPLLQTGDSVTSRRNNQQFIFEEESGEAYDSDKLNAGFWRCLTENVFSLWRPALRQKDALYLDLGCGTGRVAAWLARRGCYAIGVDATYDFLLYARQKAVRGGFENKLRFAAADLYHLPFKPAGFDALFWFGVFHHLCDPYAGFESLLNVLKPEAAVFGADNNRSLFRPLFDGLSRILPLWQEGKVPYPVLDPEIFAGILKRQGFEADYQSACFVPPHIFSFLPAKIARAVYRMAQSAAPRLGLKKEGGYFILKATRPAQPRPLPQKKH